jgi:hypothetical protein
MDQLHIFREGRVGSQQQATKLLPPVGLKNFLRVAQNKRVLLKLLPEVVQTLLTSGFDAVQEVLIVNNGAVNTSTRFRRGAATPPNTPANIGPLAQATVKIVEEGTAGAEYSSPFAEADQTLLTAARTWKKKTKGGMVTISCEDTDVIVGLCSKALQIDPDKTGLFVLRGIGLKRKRTSIHQAREKHEREHGKVKMEPVWNALIAAHCLTGCDTNNYLYGIGKRAMWKTLLGFAQTTIGSTMLKQLALLGNANPPKTSFHAAESFACALYGNASAISLDDIRGLKWKAHQTDPKRMPQPSSTFVYHTQRAHGQTLLWDLCVTMELDEIVLPDPAGFHKDADTGRWRMTVHGAGELHAPRLLLQNDGCKCSSSQQNPENRHYCRTTKCTCFLKGVECTARCKCMVGKNECKNSEGQVSIRRQLAANKKKKKKRATGGKSATRPPRFKAVLSESEEMSGDSAGSGVSGDSAGSGVSGDSEGSGDDESTVENEGAALQSATPTTQTAEPATSEPEHIDFTDYPVHSLLDRKKLKGANGVWRMHYLAWWSGYDKPKPNSNGNWYPVSDFNTLSHFSDMLEDMLDTPKFKKMRPATRDTIREQDKVNLDVDEPVSEGDEMDWPGSDEDEDEDEGGVDEDEDENGDNWG